MMKEKIPNNFNYELFREMRKTSGYTLREIAESLNVELNSVHNWEKGKYAPRDINLKKIENLLVVKEGFFNLTNSTEDVTHNPSQKLQIDAWVYEFLLFLSLREKSLSDVDSLPKENYDIIQTKIISLKKSLLDAVFKKQ